jgi:hypothetical protein
VTDGFDGCAPDEFRLEQHRGGWLLVHGDKAVRLRKRPKIYTHSRGEFIRTLEKLWRWNAAQQGAGR